MIGALVEAASAMEFAKGDDAWRKDIDANYVSFGRQVAMDFGVSLQCMATNRSLLPYVDEIAVQRLQTPILRGFPPLV